MYTKRNFTAIPRGLGDLFEDVFNNGWNHLNAEMNTFGVPVNVQETDKSYELHVVAPGLKKEDFKLNLERNMLTISYEHKDENKETETGKWIRNEYRMRSFKRNFTVSEKIDASKIAAKYADGVLIVSLPKKEVTEPAAHAITVN